VCRDGQGYLLVLGAAALWSTSGLFIRWSVGSGAFSALSLAFWRDLTTFVCLLVLLALLRPRWLSVQRKDLPWLAALGVVGVGTFHFLWNLSILYLGYAVATILLYASPAFVACMAWLLWREPLTRSKIVAIAMTLIGCVLVAGGEELAGVELTAGGLILGLSAALAYGSFSLLGRQPAQHYRPWTVLAYGFGFGALVLLPFQLAAGWPGTMSGSAWLWFGGLVVIATILPFGAYLAGLHWLPVSVASILATSEVVFAALIGYLIFGEQLQTQQIVGAGLVVTGVVLIVTRGSPRSVPGQTTQGQ
jgi:drug/metabolite transporter (DMT)-like permease